MKINNFIGNPKYYFLLFLKRVNNKLHDKFEKRYKIDELITEDYFNAKLWKIVLKLLRYNEDSLYIETKIQNNNNPLILSQSRVLLALVESYNNQESLIKSKWLIKGFVNYIKQQRNNKGLYTFNYPAWDRQDEGIATVWSILALLKANQILKDERTNEFIKETINNIFEELYTERTSLLHTKGDNYWCLNAASTFAYTLKLYLDMKYDNRYEQAMNKSVKLCLEKIQSDGHFPYSEKKMGTYILLYHPVVIYTLEMCKNSSYLNKELKKSLTTNLNKARQYLLTQMNKDGYFVEPEVKKYSRYVISNITSLVALKKYISQEQELKILRNVINYMKEDKIFLCTSDEMKLFNSSLYKLRDQLSIEVLYWLETYKNK